MATYTSPDGIYKPDSTDQVTPLETPFANMATTIQAALDKREIYTYRWADASERNATTGMRAGDTGYQADEDTVYRRVGSTWKVWERPETQYAPTVAPAVGTGGTTVARYSVSSGLVFVQIRSTLGTSGFSIGDVRYSVPLAMDTTHMNASISPLGFCSFYDNSATATHSGWMAYFDTNTAQCRRTYVSGTTVLNSNTSSSAPFTWAANDRIHAWFSYRISL